MPTAVVIRRATPRDADSLSIFAAATFPLGGRPNTDPADLSAHIAAELAPDRFRALIADPHVSLLVAECDGRLAGYTAIVRECPHPHIEARFPAELRKLYVDPEFHGRGIAHALVREALQASQAPMDVVWLSVFSENPRAIAFYKRCGFRVVGEQIYFVGNDPQNDFLMRLDL